jgi:hypothetical protein
MSPSLLPLTPREQEILSLCFRSTEDPRDIGILVALLSVEDPEGEDPDP